VVSWTIIVEKIRYFKRSSKEGNEFRRVFKDESSLSTLLAKAKEYPASCEAQLVLLIGSEIISGELRSLNFLDKFMDARMDSIIAGWESYLIFLSTTATISPFLGLLGTVWGIMSSFISMGARGSADLYVVGPGIAEALITTIFGLGAAIPAVIGYNYMVRIIRRKEDDLSSFMVIFRSRLLEGRYHELKKSAE
jgi:biopolymer transport protein TolQ